jgi:renal tumor antigen
MRKYRLVAKKGEGTFSEVLKAQNVKDGKYHAIKCMKNRFESIDQVNNLREIQALRRLSPHEHVITLEEVLYDQPTGRLALVFELMDANLYELIRGKKKTPARTSLLIVVDCYPSILVVEQHLVPSVQGGGIT